MHCLGKGGVTSNMERDESTGHKMGRNVTNPPPLRDESTGHKRDLHPRVTHPPQLPVIQNLETIPPTAAERGERPLFAF